MMRRGRPVTLLTLLTVLALSATAWSAQAGAVTLAPVTGSGGCLLVPAEAAIPGCSRAGALDTHIVPSPDGRDVYVGSFSDVRLTLLRRDRRTGRLRTHPGRQACFGGSSNYALHLRCIAPAYGTGGTVDALAISRDGRFLYVSQNGVIQVLARSARTGLVKPLHQAGACIGEIGSQLGGCAPVLHGVAELAVSGDGRTLYAGGSSTIDVITLDRRHGTMRRLGGRHGCVAEAPRSRNQRSCTAARGIGDVTDLAVAPDGRDVYTAGAGDHGIGAFRRARDGGLSQTVQYPCLTEDGADPASSDGGPGSCQDGKALEGAAALAFSPDGTRIFVAGDSSSTSGSAAVSVIDRTPRTGAIHQGGCFTGDGTDPEDPDHGTCSLLPWVSDIDDVAVAGGGRVLLLGGTYFSTTSDLSRTVVTALPITGDDPTAAGYGCAADGTLVPCTVAPAMGSVFGVEPGGAQVNTLGDGNLRVLNVRR